MMLSLCMPSRLRVTQTNVTLFFNFSLPISESFKEVKIVGVSGVVIKAVKGTFPYVA